MRSTHRAAIAGMLAVPLFLGAATLALATSHETPPPAPEADAPASTTTGTRKVEEKAPGFGLGVLGPNVTLSNIQVYEDERGEFVDIPWIADLVSQLYKWAVGAAAVVAASMIMFGGFQYLTAGGDSGRVTAAKTRISDALVGLLITVGSFFLLNTISGQFIELKSISVRTVERVPFERTLGTTREDTTGTSGGGGGGGSAGAMAPGTWTATMTSCPVNLTVADDGVHRERSHEFYRLVRAAIPAGLSAAQKVMWVAEASLMCQVKFGSCGTTAGTIHALAGVGGSTPGCFEGRGNSCNGNRGSTVFSLTDQQRVITYGQRCEVDPVTVRYHVRHGWGNGVYPRSDCTRNGGEARQRVLRYLQEQKTAGRLRGAPNWPDDVADRLQPGDYVVVYNGNTDLVGAHAVIFVGWASGGRMQVIQSAWGRTVYGGTICVKSTCGDRQTPILGAWHAD